MTIGVPLQHSSKVCCPLGLVFGRRKRLDHLCPHDIMGLFQKGCEDWVILNGQKLTQLWHKARCLVSKHEEPCIGRHRVVQSRKAAQWPAQTGRRKL